MRRALVAGALAAVAVTAAAREVRILGPDGKPAPGAVAWITRTDALDRVAADPHSGLVTIPDAGVEAACAIAPGLQPTAVAAAGEIRLLAGEPLAGTLRTSGTEAGIPGALVRLHGDEILGPCARQAAPDEQGRWLLTGLPAGTITVDIVQAPGHLIPPPRPALAGTGRRLDLELHRSAVLTATVIGPEAKPLAGVTVRVLPQWRSRPLEPPAWDELRKSVEEWRGTTDAAGVASLAPLPWRAGWRVAAEHPALAPASVVVPLDAATKQASVTLRPGATITLRALREDATPLSGATAAVIPVEGADLDLAPPAAPSGADGIVRLARVPAGRLALEVRAPGMLPEIVRGLESRPEADLQVGDVVLEPGLTLNGRVVSGGEGVGGADIVLHADGEAGSVRRETTSADDGAFTVDGLSAATGIHLKVKSQGHATKREDLPAGTTEITVDLAPVRDLLVELRDRSTSERLLGGGAQLAVDGRWPKIESEPATGDEGVLVLQAVPHGTHAVTGWAPGHAPVSRPDLVVDGQSPATITLDLQEAREIQGTALDARSRRPVEGARVRGPQPVPVLTGSDGSFVLDGITGPFTLEVEHDAHLELSTGVDPDALPSEGLVVLLEPGGSVEGVVHGRDGRPLAGAQVTHGDRRVLTEASGRYRMDGIKPGFVQVVKTDRPGTIDGREAARVEVPAGGVARCDFGLGARLHGVVTLDGKPLGGAVLSLMKVPAKDAPESWVQPEAAGRTDAEGRYEIAGLGAGLHVLNVSWGVIASTREVDVAEATRDVPLDVDLDAMRVEGTVVDADTRLPVSGASVEVRPPPSDRHDMMSIETVSDDDGRVTQLVSGTIAQSSATTSIDGRFSVRVLQPGPLVLTARRSLYQDGSQPVTGSTSGLLIELQPKQEERRRRLVVRLLDAQTGGLLPGSMAAWSEGGSSFTQGSGSMSLTLDPSQLPQAIFVWSRGRAIATSTITAEDMGEGDVTRDFQLVAGGSVRIHVPDGVLEGSLTCSAEMPLAIELESGFDILGDHRNFCLNVGQRLVTAEGDGSWLVADLPEGPVTVTVRGLPPKTVDVVPRETVTADFR